MICRRFTSGFLGKYFNSYQNDWTSPYAKNEKMSTRLWELSTQLTSGAIEKEKKRRKEQEQQRRLLEEAMKKEKREQEEKSRSEAQRNQ